MAKVVRSIKCPFCQATVTSTSSPESPIIKCSQCGRSLIATRTSAGSIAPADGAMVRTTDTSRWKSTVDGSPETGPAKSTDEPTLRKLGRFELKAILGQGNFGRVYRAYDPQLDRFVAIKVPTFSVSDELRVTRFISEARAAARLRHPNIVPTYESGRIGEQFYIAAQFISGVPLSRRLQNSPPDFRQSVEWARQLADALAYAHREGIMHRDIKPDNIMLDDKLIPQIMDFGLARRINEDAGMTADGSILGTPAYMAPEQARGEQDKIGPHSDQYSLGVVLYEMLTGQRPFDGSPHAVLTQLLSAEPVAPRTLRPDVPRDLEAICLKAMDKEPARRYSDAHEFASDLGRWLAGVPVSARTPRLHERVWKWTRRNPAVAALSAGILAIAVCAFLGISAALGMAIQSGQRAISDRNAAQTARDQANGLAADLQLQKDQLQSALNDLRRQTNRADEKTAEVSKLDIQLQQVRLNIEQAEARMRSAQAEGKAAAAQAEQAKKLADGARAQVEIETKRAQRIIASSYFDLGLRRCEDGKVAEGALWLVRSYETNPDDAEQSATIRAALTRYLVSDAADRGQASLRIVLTHDNPITSAAFHPDERWIATGDRTGQLGLWSTQDDKVLSTVAAHDGRICNIQFCPSDPELLMSAGEDGKISIWRISRDHQLEAHASAMQNSFAVTTASWSHDGRWILAGGDQSRHMRLWNAASRTTAGPAFGGENAGRVMSLAFLPPDSRTKVATPMALVGTGLLHKGVSLWDAVKGKPALGRQPLSTPADVVAVAFESNGIRAAAATLDKHVWLIDVGNWRLAQQKPALVLPAEPSCLAWCANQPWLLTGCRDGSAVLWDAEVGDQRSSKILHEGAVTAVAFDHRAEEFLTAGEDKTVRIWKLPQVRARREISVGSPISALALNSDGRKLVAASGRDLSVWDTENGNRLLDIRDRTATVTSIAFAPTEDIFAVGEGNSLRLWSARTWKPIGVEMKCADRVLSICFSSDSTRIAATCADGTARIWDCGTQEPVSSPLSHPELVTSATFNANDSRLITGCSDGQVRVWKWMETAEVERTFAAEGAVRSVSVADDHQTLVAASEQGNLFAWDLRSGNAIGPAFGSADAMRHVAILPGSKNVLVATSGGIETWSVMAGQRFGFKTSFDSPIIACAMSHDGRMVAAARESEQGRLTVWGLPQTLQASPARLSAWVMNSTGAKLSPSGEVLPLSGAELQAIRQRLAKLEAAESKSK